MKRFSQSVALVSGPRYLRHAVAVSLSGTAGSPGSVTVNVAGDTADGYPTGTVTINVNGSTVDTVAIAASGDGFTASSGGNPVTFGAGDTVSASYSGDNIYQPGSTGGSGGGQKRQ